MEYELLSTQVFTSIEKLTEGTVCSFCQNTIKGSLQLLLLHTSVIGPQGLGLSGLSGRLDEDGGGDWSVGDGDLAKAAGPKPEKEEQNNNLGPHAPTFKCLTSADVEVTTV